MEQWLSDNIVAVYAAIVGTVALFINFSRLWIAVAHSKVRFRVSSIECSDAQDQLNYLVGDDPYNEHSLIGPLYEITVTNYGKVDIFLGDVGIFVKTGLFKSENIHALTRGAQWLQTVTQSGGILLTAGSKKSFSVYIRRESAFNEKVVRAYANTQAGIKVKGTHKRLSKLQDPRK